MKRVLARLMARQQRLMDELQPAKRTIAASKRTRTPLTVEQMQSLLDQELRALDAAFASLADGDPGKAEAILQPIADTAQDTRTLTTLARIASERDDTDVALALLQRAEALSATDPKVLHFMAELLRRLGRHADELQYRRRAAFTDADGPAVAFAHLIPAIVRAAPREGQLPLTEVRLALDRVKQAKDLPQARSVEVAEAIFGIPSMREEAVDLYAKAAPPLADERDTAATKQTLHAWCAENSAAEYRINTEGVPGRRPAFAELLDAIVVPSFQWLPFPGNGRTVLSEVASRRLGLRSEDSASPILLAGKADALLRFPKQLTSIDEPVVLVGGSGDYYNDLIEFTGTLAIPDVLDLGTDMRFLVNSDLAAHQLELFALLGISESRLLRCDRLHALRVMSLWTPTRLTAGDVWCDPLVARWYRQKMAKLMSSAPPSRKLYLSSSDAGDGRVVNDAEVAAALAKIGFETVYTERLCLEEQVRLWSQASHIVSAPTPVLGNLVFTQPQSKVTLLTSPPRSASAYQRLAEACALDVLAVRCTVPGTSMLKRASDRAVLVDCDQLLKRLQ